MQSLKIAPSCENCVARRYSLFSTCATHEMSEIGDAKHSSYYKKGQVLYSEGNIPQGLFCLYEGKVKLYRTGIDGKEQIIRLGQPGDILGYRSLIAGEGYSTSAAALENTIACFIPRKVFLDTLEKTPHLWHKMMRVLCRDLGIADERIQSMAQKVVRERLAEILLILKETIRPEVGQPENLINISMSREDIANLIGTATETVIRLLSEFKEDGLISFDRRRILILNVQKLARIAQIA